jgi:hypothetical protein
VRYCGQEGGVGPKPHPSCNGSHMAQQMRSDLATGMRQAGKEKGPVWAEPRLNRVGAGDDESGADFVSDRTHLRKTNNFVGEGKQSLTEEHVF